MEKQKEKSSSAFLEPRKSKKIISSVLIKKDTLCVRRVTEFYSNLVLVDSKTEEDLYPLHKVSKKDIFQLRLGDDPYFILKLKGSFYCASIPKNLRLVAQSDLGLHLCQYCKRLSAAADCDGGCAKVRDISFYKNSSDNISHVIQKSKRIEKYDFIYQGYETINILTPSHSGDVFVVTECAHYVQETDEIVQPKTSVIAGYRLT